MLEMICMICFVIWGLLIVVVGRSPPPEAGFVPRVIAVPEGRYIDTPFSTAHPPGGCCHTAMS